MSDHLTPLEVCERLIGPLEQIARVTQQHPKTPYTWRRPAKGRDGGDLPSARLGRQLLAHSDAHDLGLTAEHLLRGANVAEIEQILAARAVPQIRGAA